MACLSVDTFIFVHEIYQCAGVKSNLKSKIGLNKLIRMVVKQSLGASFTKMMSSVMPSSCWFDC